MGQCQQQEKKGKWTLFVWDEEGKVLFQSQHGVDLVCSGRLNMMRERTGVGIRLEDQTAFFSFIFFFFSLISISFNLINFSF